VVLLFNFNYMRVEAVGDLELDGLKQEFEGKKLVFEPLVHDVDGVSTEWRELRVCVVTGVRRCMDKGIDLDIKNYETGNPGVLRLSKAIREQIQNGEITIYGNGSE
jgi:hypothetical protein